MEESKLEKQKVENDLKEQLDNFQKQHQSLSVRLQTAVSEKTEAEAKLTQATADCSQLKTLVSNLENTQKNLKEELRLMMATKDDVSQKLALTLQKLEAVQLNLVQRESADGKREEEEEDVESIELEGSSSHLQGRVAGRIGDGRSLEASPHDFLLQNGQMDESLENKDLDQSRQTTENEQKVRNYLSFFFFCKSF